MATNEGMVIWEVLDNGLLVGQHFVNDEVGGKVAAG